MKRFRYLLLVLMFFPLLGFIGCGSQELVIDQAVWLYDIGQEIRYDDFNVDLVNGDETTSIDSYSFDSNFDSKKEGIYNIEIGYASLSAIASIVVIDFDRFNLYAGQSLGDIVLPENVYFENASKIYTATGKYTEKLCFNDNGIVKDTAVIVEVSQNQNEWIVYPTIEDWTYGESPAVVNAQSKYGEIVYSYYTVENVLLKNIPTQTGEYYLKAEVNGTDSYTSLSAKVPFEIKKADVTIAPLTNLVTKIYDASFEYTGDILSLIEFSSTVDCLDYIKPVDAYFANDNYEKDCNVGEKILIIELELVDSKNLTFSGKNSTIIELKAEIIPLSADILSNPTPSLAVYGQELSSVTLTDGVVKTYLYQNSQLTYSQIDGRWSFKNSTDILKDSGKYDIIFIPTDKNIESIETQIYLDVTVNLDIDVSIDGAECSYTQQANEIYIEIPAGSSICEISFNELEGISCSYTVYYDELVQESNSNYEDYIVYTVDFEDINQMIIKVNLTGDRTAEFTIFIQLEQIVVMKVNGEQQSFNYTVKVGDRLTFETKEGTSLYIDGEAINGEYIVPEYYKGISIYLEAYDIYGMYYFFFINVE